MHAGVSVSAPSGKLGIGFARVECREAASPAKANQDFASKVR